MFWTSGWGMKNINPFIKSLMEKKLISHFFGFAIIVDLRNFSEICRRLLIKREEPQINEAKKLLYGVIFNFLTSALDKINGKNEGILFDYKHTGDGFLFLTKHSPHKSLNSINSFIFVLDVHSCMLDTVKELNLSIIEILKNNQNIIKDSKHLSYTRDLFRDSSRIKWQSYLDFSVGAHCDKVFHQALDDKKLFLGNSINQASRLQSLSTTFSDFNLFFSEQIAKNLKKAMKNSILYEEISEKWFNDLGRIEIKGLGPTRIQAVGRENINEVRKKLRSLIVG